MKKVISVCLCMLLAVSALCFAAAAEGGKLPEITASDATGNPGNSIYVCVSVFNNTEITDYAFSVEFEKSVLKYEGYIKGVLDDYVLYDHSDEGRVTLASLNAESAPANGAVITFKFSIDKKAKPGDYKIALAKTYFADKDGKAKSADVKGGKVTVSSPCGKKHQFPKWKSFIAATCLEEGADIRVCEKCGCTELKQAKAKGHKLEKTFTLDRKLEGSRPGMLSRHCKECGAKTNIIIYTKDNHVGLKINDMVGKVSDDTLSNLIYFINGGVTYPDITDDGADAAVSLKNTDKVRNENGSINVAAAVDRVLRKLFGDNKNGGIIGAVKHAALADELPTSFINKLVRLLFCR